MLKSKVLLLKLLDNGKFDLVFNINAGEKFFFNDLKLNIPKDYDRNNFLRLIPY